MFFEALYFGHFLLFYTMQLAPPKCVAEGIGGRCCRWLWCGVTTRACSSPGVWLVVVFGMRVCASVAVCVAV